MGANFLLVLILVRLLPANVYSGVVLTKVSLLLITSLAGVGLSQAAVRWHGLKEKAGQVLGTVLYGAVLMSVTGAIILLLLVNLFGERLGLQLDPLLALAIVVLVVSFMVNNELVNWERAKHRSMRHAVYSTVRGLLQLSSVVTIVMLIKESSGFVYGMATGEAIFTAVLLFLSRQEIDFSKEKKLLKKMIAYGWPHTLVITSGFMLTYADRYMLSFMMKDESVVAYYDAAYMVVISFLSLLIRPFNLFLFPAYTKRYKNEGEASTVSMVTRAQKLFIFFGIGLATTIVVLRIPILELLFPPGYIAGASIFAPVAFSILLNGVFMATVAGLYLIDKTVMVGVASLLAMAINIIANYILIPLYGMDGAAYGTAIASLVQLGIAYKYSRSSLPVKLPIAFLLFGGFWLLFIQWLVA